MRVAITYENGLVFQHFGHTQEFKIYDIENNEIINSNIISTNGSGHSALAKFLLDLNVNAVICGGIGMGAINALNNVGIKVMAGVSGFVDHRIEQFINNKLEYSETSNCSHHDHEHSHTCSEHGCK